MRIVKGYLTIVFIIAFRALLEAQLLIPQHWQLRKTYDSSFIVSANVPGSVHADLLTEHKIPDPYFGTNENKVSWVDTTTWEYHSAIYLSKEQASNGNSELIAEGLDTYAEIWLNGHLLGKADNMFIPWSFPIKGIAKEGENKLCIRFFPATIQAKSSYDRLPVRLPIDERVMARKAQFQFGWDWGPKLIGAGIFKPLYFKFAEQFHIKHISFRTKNIDKSNAKMEMELHIHSHKKQHLDLQLTESANTFKSHTFAWNVHKGLNKIVLSFEVTNPKMWWPHDHGDPFLYRPNLQVKSAGNMLANASGKFGIRQLKLLRQADSIGESFVFQINGKNVFIKGANYIPMDILNNSIPEAKQIELLNMAKMAHMNMLRIWGGGLYETDRFYDVCDSLGILVWQDFMFACSFYPGDSSFFKQIEKEVRHQVMRLRGHASLALWCGNNEIDEAWFNWGYQKAYGYSMQDSIRIRRDYQKLFHSLIPSILKQIDPERPYYASSPLFGWGKKESMTHGDAHYWGVWWGEEPFEKYLEKVPRFMSEYGFQALPDRQTILEMDGLSKPLTDSVWLQHQKHPRGYQIIKKAMESYAVVPNQLEDFAYLSQHLQAKAYKLAIEAHRRNKPFCMGTLFWQLNDCWPVVSWSVMDYKLRPKAAYYQVKSSYEPIILSAIKQNNYIQCFLINDKPIPISDTLFWSLETLNGVVLRGDNFPLTLHGDTSQRVHQLAISELEGFKKEEVFLHYRFKDKEELVLLAPEPEVHWPDNSVQVKWKQAGNTWLIALESQSLHRGVQLRSDIPGRFNENYFDLYPNEIKEIKFEAENEQMLKLHFRSLNMFYNQQKQNDQN